MYLIFFKEYTIDKFLIKLTPVRCLVQLDRNELKKNTKWVYT